MKMEISKEWQEFNLAHPDLSDTMKHNREHYGKRLLLKGVAEFMELNPSANMSEILFHAFEIGVTYGMRDRGFLGLMFDLHSAKLYSSKRKKCSRSEAEKAVRSCNGSIRKAANKLGCSQRTIKRRLQGK